MIDEDLRKFLLGVWAVGTRNLPVEKGRISEEQQSSRIYFQRSEANTDVFLGGSAGNTETTFDVEVASLDEDTTQTVASSIKTALNGYPANGYAGAGFGVTQVLGCFVQDHSDDYQPKLLDADEGYSVASFQVLVIQ